MTNNKENPFARRIIITTGKLEHFIRDEIIIEILRLEDKPGNSVSKKTDYLICGEKDQKQTDKSSRFWELRFCLKKNSL